LRFKFSHLKEPKIYGKENSIKLICLDCGIKENIIRNLVKRGAQVKVVPWDYDFTHESYDGLFISNGPGLLVLFKKTIRKKRNRMI
jgi:carbamoylphosphate synthase small subunit